MSGKKGIIIIVILVTMILIGGVGGYFYIKNSSAEPDKLERYAYTTEDMYCNIKNSKSIVKIKITVTTTDSDKVEDIGKSSYLIRDTANKIIRNTTEEELQGNEGQINLQKEIMKKIIELMPDCKIVDVYFDDFVIQ